jgi:hypothetical protein
MNLHSKRSHPEPLRRGTSQLVECVVFARSFATLRTTREERFC